MGRWAGGQLAGAEGINSRQELSNAVVQEVSKLRRAKRG